MVLTDEFLETFIHILTKGRKDNTYKFALAKFLLDYSKDIKEEENKTITFRDIAASFLKYYWYQEFKYKLKQDFKKEKQPVVITILQKYCGNEYIHLSYEKYFEDKKDIEEKIINEIEKECLNDVIPRFQPDEKEIFYEHFFIKKGKKYTLLEKERRYIVLHSEAISFFKENYNILNKVLVLEWAKFLEKVNFTPKLISKIENLGKKEKRSSLRKFLKILLEIDKGKCFYCGKNLSSNEEIHIDHFIPWSYIYDDQLWNLVLSCRDCNLKKSDYLPPEKCLIKIKQRARLNPFITEGRNIDIEEIYSNCKKAGFLITKEILCV